VTYIVAHLSLLVGSRQRQVVDLTRFAIETEGPLVIMGDLNALPDSPELEVLVTEAGMTRVPLGETFPSWNPAKALDHFFVSPHIEVTDAFVPEMRLSDHRPILMEFELGTL
jgi:endonuclease/exonuclease/phosphatase family metal-dependent hydrolase